ncbi:hypothetical protein LEP1GSC074_0642 [Leptospira noguchii str. Hook]|uniref:Uncharacterized protein n=2 Tax=Leptospira noguchii TaxID=28182 RepID=M6YFK2_9LEPT|nr:hypothetical protein LEP1GSC041_3073 [Leptospira noguchii str. 2006001870]EMO40769.1 hypothetical protein LEP1GSC186_0566 [Leptospira noguchii serovar Autumnalis str. ZUN142]EMO90636.1 hypothetical protein LEP1GSC024_1093 [Leptospira noguchii str. 2001034031]EMS87916.1 hypothetical protein LEP1GSC074_0642 [Leptospira noguchii str. Hook]
MQFPKIVAIAKIFLNLEIKFENVPYTFTWKTFSIIFCKLYFVLKISSFLDLKGN